MYIISLIEYCILAKILDIDVMNNPLKLKFVDTLIQPILTYGSKIWLTDFKIKENISDRLPVVKIPNKFCKYLLGVHTKASNFAAKLELVALLNLSSWCLM